MSITEWAITVYCTVFCAGWCIMYLQCIRSIFAVPVFEKQNPRIPAKYPYLSIVVPACNEADVIEDAISTLLRQDYPDFEIVLVNDRSNDGTGEIIEHLADQDSRIKPIHISNLPPGWIGKVYAMNIGTQKAKGDWILYTDADVHFKEGALRKAVALVLTGKADHLTVMPSSDSSSFWMKVLLQTFGIIFLQAINAADIGKPHSNAFAGVGAFNFVKKSALYRTEGFSWLRMEVADDVGLGLLLHKAGAKTSFAISSGDISLIWYPSIRAMFRGLEKNLFGVSAHYSILRMILILISWWSLIIAPVISILYWKVPYLWIAGGIVYLLIIISALTAKIRFKQNMIPMMLGQVGQLIISAMLLRSAIMCKIRGGILWRGTLYKTDDLRAGQRVKF